MQTETLAINDPRWHDALGRSHHDFYHLPAYVRLEAERTQSAPEAFLFRDGARQFFVPYLLRSCNSLFPELNTPTYDVVSPYGYPGILLNEAGWDSAFAAAGFAALQETWRARGVCTAFLRMHPILGDDLPNILPAEAVTDTSETVAVDLQQDEHVLFKQIRSGHQEILKKCNKLGYVARFVALGDVLHPFIDIYEQTMDRVRAKETYYFDRAYFNALADMPGVHCCIVESDATIIAACVFFECGGMVQAHLGGTRTEFFSKSPFHLSLYKAILWSKSRGNRWLHLGGGVGGSNDTLLHFKSGFSPARFHFHTSRITLNPTLYCQLVEMKAKIDGISPDELYASHFFPVYRS